MSLAATVLGGAFSGVVVGAPPWGVLICKQPKLQNREA
jgi:hypothetical protein